MKMAILALLFQNSVFPPVGTGTLERYSESQSTYYMVQRHSFLWHWCLRNGYDQRRSLDTMEAVAEIMNGCSFQRDMIRWAFLDVAQQQGRDLTSARLEIDHIMATMELEARFDLALILDGHVPPNGYRPAEQPR